MNPERPGAGGEDDSVLLSDIFPTGYHATELAKVQPGDGVAIPIDFTRGDPVEQIMRLRRDNRGIRARAGDRARKRTPGKAISSCRELVR